ncbi:MAG TPA: hypothetical protein DD377_05970 [Firmicutes bacterium]|nr:hypothetical protein [Bacillota bacterium]
MINKELLAKAYPSRPRKIFIPFAILFFLILLFASFLIFLFPNIPSLIEIADSFGEIIPPGSKESISFSLFLSTYICPVCCVASSCLAGILTLVLATRKWWYHIFNVFIVLGIVFLAVGTICNLFLLSYIPEDFHSLIPLVCSISTYVCLGSSFLSLLFCFFDNHLPLRKYKPIYKRLKFLIKSTDEKSKKKELKKKFNYYFKKKKFDDLLLLLFSNEFAIDSNKTLSKDAYEFIKKDIISMLSKLKEKELDELYSKRMDFAIRKERQNLLDSINGKTDKPNNNEIKNEIPPLDETKIVEEPIVSKKMLKKAKKAELKALKKAEKEKKKQNKKEAI